MSKSQKTIEPFDNVDGAVRDIQGPAVHNVPRSTIPTSDRLILWSGIEQVLATKADVEGSRLEFEKATNTFWNDAVELRGTSKALSKVAKQLWSKFLELANLEENEENELTMLMKKLQSKSSRLHKQLQRLDNHLVDMNRHTEVLSHAEDHLFAICDAVRYGKPIGTVTQRNHNTNNTDDGEESPSIVSTTSEALDPLVHEFYDKIGDLKLIGERIYNLEAKFRVEKTYRETDKEENITPSVASTEFYANYFQKKHTLLKDFSEAKEAALANYNKCRERNLPVDDVDLDPLLPKPVDGAHMNPGRPAFDVDHPANMEAPSAWNKSNFTSLKETRTIPVNIHYWRKGIGDQAEDFASLSALDPATPPFSSSKAPSQQGKAFGRLTSHAQPGLEMTHARPSVSSQEEWLLLDGHDIVDGELANLPAASFHGSNSRFLDPFVRHYYSLPDLQNRKKSEIMVADNH